MPELKGSRTEANLLAAFAGESQARNKYTYYASKAKKDGYVECWTVVNVDRIDMNMAQKESPTTNKFYRISELLNQSSAEYRDFSLQILSIAGI